MDIRSLIRPNILAMGRCSKAAHTSLQNARIRLNKGESPFNAPQNRYPDGDLEGKLAAAIAAAQGMVPANVGLAGSTDEIIDRLLRVFCTPQRDNIILAVPSTANCECLAEINDIELRYVPLDQGFALRADKIMSQANQRSKILLLSSPNVPTGNLLSRDTILSVADRFKGIVVVNEAYIEYARTPSLAADIAQHPNLAVARTFSKAYASAALRLSYLLAHPDIVHHFNLVRPSGILPTHTLTEGLALLRRRFDVDKWIKWQLEERGKVIAAVKQLPLCLKLYPTDANFFMIKVPDAPALLRYLAEQEIAACDCSGLPGCDNCIAFTVSLTPDNNALLSALRKYCE